MSGGMLQAAGGGKNVKQALAPFRNSEATDLLNEFAFSVKSKLNKEEMPERDHSLIILDAAAQLLQVKDYTAGQQ